MRIVTLVDGRQVDDWSEEWRHECEARSVLNFKSKRARQNYLFGTIDDRGKAKGGVLQVRGEAACKRLEETILLLWKAANDNKR